MGGVPGVVTGEPFLNGARACTHLVLCSTSRTVQLAVHSSSEQYKQLLIVRSNATIHFTFTIWGFFVCSSRRWRETLPLAIQSCPHTAPPPPFLSHLLCYVLLCYVLFCFVPSSYGRSIHSDSYHLVPVRRRRG